MKAGFRWVALGATAATFVAALTACGDDSSGSTGTPGPSGAETAPTKAPPQKAPPQKAPAPAATAAAIPDDLPNGLLLAYSQFGVDNGEVSTQRLMPARLEILTRRGGEWHTTVIADEDSNVFHKALVYDGAGGPAILTIGGNAAAVKLWRTGAEGFTATTIWTEEFGGTQNRMRDVEVGDVYGDGKLDIVVGTHDQGIAAVLRPQEDGSFEVVRLDRRPNIWIHEIELGDLDGDGTLEVYATPSEPNTLEGDAEQHGEVVRYVPKDGQGRTVVADLGNRHAKEILVADVDGDGRDELYVAVEALTRRGEQGVEIVEPVEIRRYDHDTAPDAGAVIARIDDERFTRFLTWGDVDGDGKSEMVVASMRRGLWLLRPGTDPRGEWSKESIDRDSGGFEHASIVADLDGDGNSELYVAADDDGELRRYAWVNGRARRETIHSRERPREMMTWNIMPVPVSLLAVTGD